MAKQRTTRKQRSDTKAQQLEHQKLRREHEHASRPLFGTASGRTPHRKPTLEQPAGQQTFPSVMTNSPLNTARPIRYEGEMELRELLAQQLIAGKRKRVAVVCHKSGYQYVGESEDPKTFGKKCQALD